MKTALLKVRTLIIENPMAAIFIMLAVFIRMVFWVYTDRIWEDALITLLPAKNVWLGHGLTHHMSEPRVHSFTSPLSVWIPLVGEAFAQGLFLLRLTALIAAAGAIYYAYRIGLLLKFHWSAQILLLGYLTFDQLQIFFGMAGMETQLATAIFLGNVYYLFQKKWTLLGLFAGLGLLVRPEFIFWIPIVGLYLLIWHPRNIISVLIPFLCVVLPWYLLTYFYYGSIIPHTIIAKSIGGARIPFEAPITSVLEYFMSSWQNMAPFKQWYFLSSAPIPLFLMIITVQIVIGLLILGIVKAWHTRHYPLLVVALFLLIFISYRTVTVLHFYYMWYLPPFLALLFLLAAYGLSNLAINHKKLAAFLGCFIGLMYAMHIPFSFPVEKMVQEKIEYGVRLKTGQILNEMMGAKDTAVLEPLGYMGYAALNKTIYDYPGMSSKIAVNAVKESNNKSLSGLIATLMPSFIVLRPREIEAFLTTEPRAFKNYQQIAHIYAKENTDLSKWGYSSQENLHTDGDFKIFKRITPQNGDRALEPLHTFFTKENMQTWPSVVYIAETELPKPEAFILTQPLLTQGIAEYYQRTPKIRSPLHIEEDVKNHHFYRAIIMIVDNNAQRDNAIKADMHKESTIVELGLISINFSALPLSVIKGVRAGETPFGTLLLDNHIKTYNTDTHYFKIICDPHFASVLQCQPNETLFGRTNTLVRDDNHIWVARVVEILTGAKKH